MIRPSGGEPAITGQVRVGRSGEARDRAGLRQSLCHTTATARNTVEVARRALRLFIAAPSDRAAVYRANAHGLALVVALRGEKRWDVPAAIEPMLPELAAFNEASATDQLILPDTAGPFAGCSASAIRGPEGLLGVLLLERAPEAVEDAVDVSLVSALVGARLRIDEERRGRNGTSLAQQVRNETLAATGMLSAGVAHELNNPLNVVMGLAELMVLDDTVDENVRNDARLIVEEARRAVSVVRQLLSYGRGGDLSREPVELREILECCVGVFEASVRDSGIEVSRSFCEDPVVVRADPFRLQQAVLAILDNGRLAVEAGESETGNIQVELRCDDGGDDGGGVAIVEFTDSGEGLSAEVISRVFDPFFTTRAPGSGSGMGLALVDRAVREVGGTIECENHPRGGACFRVSLPLAE